MPTSSIVKRSIFTAGVVSLIGVFSNPSHAAIANGSFETGNFSGWETIGNTSTQTSAYGSGPTAGNFQALLSTSNSTRPTDLENFLGVTPFSLDNFSNSSIFQGSAIKQSFTADAGQVLTFDWNFLSSGIEPVASFNDFSFVSIGFLSKLGDTFSPSVPSLTSLFDRETGFKTFSYTIPTTGAYSLKIGIADASDGVSVSGLLVDQVALSSSSTAVPEPSSGLGVLAFGALSVGSLLKRQRQTKV